MESGSLRVERRAHVRVKRGWPGAVAAFGNRPPVTLTAKDVSMAGLSADGRFAGVAGDDVLVFLRLPQAAITVWAEVVGVESSLRFRFTSFVGDSEAVLSHELLTDGDSITRAGPGFLVKLVTRP